MPFKLNILSKNYKKHISYFLIFFFVFILSISTLKAKTLEIKEIDSQEYLSLISSNNYGSEYSSELVKSIDINLDSKYIAGQIQSLSKNYQNNYGFITQINNSGRNKNINITSSTIKLLQTPNYISVDDIQIKENYVYALVAFGYKDSNLKDLYIFKYSNNLSLLNYQFVGRSMMRHDLNVGYDKIYISYTNEDRPYFNIYDFDLNKFGSYYFNDSQFKEIVSLKNGPELYMALNTTDKCFIGLTYTQFLEPNINDEGIDIDYEEAYIANSSMVICSDLSSADFGMYDVAGTVKYTDGVDTKIKGFTQRFNIDFYTVRSKLFDNEPVLNINSNGLDRSFLTTLKDGNINLKVIDKFGNITTQSIVSEAMSSGSTNISESASTQNVKQFINVESHVILAYSYSKDGKQNDVEVSEFALIR